ncbi:hypothetical protein [Veillonella sp. CHU110]|uniref:hypothetical protein n=1 Tax=Veillonella sp. CHU110 TaxID=2490947 RepID=UPI000F8D8764|nr:hypothetical protein [Veillonella sp. CHU110]
MWQVEGYIDSYYERIEGIKLIDGPSVVLDNLLVRIVEDRPNQKKYVYSFYANHIDIAKADVMILHEMCWDKAIDICTLKNDSALRNHVRKIGHGEGVPTITDSFYKIDAEKIQKIRDLATMLLHQISADEETEETEAKWSYVEVYQSTNAGYLSGGAWISHGILEKIYKDTGWEEAKGKELTLDEIICIQSM